MLIVNNDVSNAANNPAGFSAQLNAVGKPKEYTYSDASQASLQNAPASTGETAEQAS